MDRARNRTPKRLCAHNCLGMRSELRPAAARRMSQRRAPHARHHMVQTHMERARCEMRRAATI
eukprot:4802320-Lingulodinium_polyedra.AAC.1